VPGALRRLLDRGAAAEHDQVGERDLLAAGRALVELLLDALEALQHLRELGGIVDRPVLLRREPHARAVGAAAHVGAAEGGRRGPGGAHQFRTGEARGEDLGLEAAMSLASTSGWSTAGTGSCQISVFLRDLAPR
jgi:hypothetical protein